tara:strand:- start:266 stop:535 length:270 start_codon:yes stop_codon:yes gene_type:complete
MSEFDEVVPEAVVVDAVVDEITGVEGIVAESTNSLAEPEITVDAEGGGVVEVVPSIIETCVPVFSKEGILLNPGECEVDKDGVTRGKVV